MLDHAVLGVVMVEHVEFRGIEFRYIVAIVLLLLLAIVVANIFTGGKLFDFAGRIACGFTTFIGLGSTAIGLLGGCV
jgi:hypothetical protein